MVAEHKAKVTAEKRLASLRRLAGKVVSKRHLNSLRDAEGRHVEDKSRWGDTVHEHFKNKFRSDDAENPESIHELWRHRVKPNVAGGTGQHSRQDPSKEAYCTVRWWRGKLGVKIVRSKIGLSLMCGWCRRRATSRVSASGVQAV